MLAILTGLRDQGVSAIDTNLQNRVEEADGVLIGDETVPAEPLRAAELYLAAAADGSGAAAARAAMLAAVGVGRQQNWAEALDLLLQGAELGNRSAQRQLALIAGHESDRLAAGGDSNPVLWRKLRESIDIEAVLTPPQIRQLSLSPFIGVMEGFAPLAYADWMIRSAADLLEPGQIYDERTGGLYGHKMRTATVATFTILNRDVVLAVMQERAARATGRLISQHEPPNVISYLPGQKFDAHFDFLDPNTASFRPELEIFGQRIVTCLTYLNADFAGGETQFTESGLSFRGHPGDCLIFLNVHPNREPDHRTRHAGLPPTQGRKWVLSQWLRDKVQPLI